MLFVLFGQSIELIDVSRRNIIALRTTSPISTRRQSLDTAAVDGGILPLAYRTKEETTTEQQMSVLLRQLNGIRTVGFCGEAFPRRKLNDLTPHVSIAVFSRMPVQKQNAATYATRLFSYS